MGSFLLWFTLCLPSPLFDLPYSRVLEDRNGQLLGARIASDGQWRFPAPDSIPQVLTDAIITFEDKRFYTHPGVDLLALARALRQNIRAGKVVSGGSTISMQVIRMARGNKARNIWNKALETLMALRLDLGYSKKEILSLYAAHAPFGGNVVGAETAAWRYFGKPLTQISRAEAATLAVLPNNPSIIHPGRNRNALREKRNKLIRKMAAQLHLDSLYFELDLEEPVPGPPLPLPNLAPHFLEYVFANSDQSRITSTVDIQIQESILALSNQHHRRLSGNEIHNLAVLVIDLESREVLTYVGNAPEAGNLHQGDVDVVQAARSTGSILKPFLYGNALQEGLILPSSLLSDIPTTVNGFRPENYSNTFSGATPANQALARSLNVPFVRLLRSYGVDKFYYRLQKLGFSSIHSGADHYGLSLILGGAETSLWDLTRSYMGMANTLQHFHENHGQYSEGDWVEPKIKMGQARNYPYQREPLHLSAGAAWHTLEAMKTLERPSEVGQWERFTSAFPMAWKTGTSHGFRDAWAVGLTGRYAIGVWVGNADGEGRPGLVGIQSAAPLLFDVARQLPQHQDWFLAPMDDLVRIPICRESGWRAGRYCPKDTLLMPAEGLRAKVCTHHQQIYLSKDTRWRVHQACSQRWGLKLDTFFLLPPAEEYYYRSFHPNYKILPPFAPGCNSASQDQPMALIYPDRESRIFVPRDLAGKRSKTVFRAAHRNPGSAIHWHLDDQYLATTTEFHELSLDPAPGLHRITLLDEFGARVEKWFEIVERQE